MQQEELKVTGDKHVDLALFQDSLDYEFGLKLLRHYAPVNVKLLNALSTGKKDLERLERNLKVICYEDNKTVVRK